MNTAYMITGELSSFTKQDPRCYITISKLNYRMFHWIWQSAFWKVNLYLWN